MPVTQPRKPVAKRLDPRPRALDPIAGQFELKNADPNKHYVWAPEHGDIDVGFYESMGYEKVMWEEGGAAPLRSGQSRRKNGEPISHHQQYLMACPLEVKREMEAYAKADVDATEKRIITKRYGRDFFRGIGVAGSNGDIMHAINDTGPEVPVNNF